jgi:hypothetical protein
MNFARIHFKTKQDYAIERRQKEAAKRFRYIEVNGEFIAVKKPKAKKEN